MKTCPQCRAAMRDWALVVRRMLRGKKFGDLPRGAAFHTAIHFRDGDCEWHRKGGAR